MIHRDIQTFLGCLLKRDGPSLVNRRNCMGSAGPSKLSVEQDREYKQLQSTEERKEFIERFWKNLDPDLETETNERREEFWRRVNEASSLFQESLNPGWKVDRGVVYILMGAPDERIRQ